MANNEVDISSLLGPGQRFHVFLSFAQPDVAVAECIFDYLEQKGFKCMHHARDFVPGAMVLDNIIGRIKESRRVLVLLTKAYVHSDWCQAEIIYTLQDCKARETSLLIPVIDNIRADQIPHAIRSFTYIDLRHPDAKEKIVDAILAEDKAYIPRAPCGNVAQGLAWSYYYGYLRIVLPGLRDRCQQWWSAQSFDDASAGLLQQPQQLRILVPRLFVLIPKSGYCWSNLADSDPAVERLPNCLPEVRASRAGNMDRVYKNTVYSLHHRNGTRYYIPCEYATPVASMYDMEKDGLANLTLDEKQAQIRMFHDILLMILETSKDTTFKMAFHLILYQDESDDNSYKYPISKPICEAIDDVESIERRTQGLTL